jgi:peptidoglycan/LPS O-acetylase OafA/YrhL
MTIRSPLPWIQERRMAESNVSHDLAETADTAGGRDRLESLTGLRWWAAFGVFASHLNIFLPIPGTRGIFGLGVSGVTFFFILSGFVLTWTAGERDRAGWFYARRFARIWPLLLLAVVVPLAFALTSDMDVDSGQLVLIAAASVLLVQAWVPGWILFGSNPVTWSLSCEAFFYALFPFLRGTVARRTLRQLALVAVVLVLVGWAIRVALWLAYPVKAELTADDLNSSGLLVLGTYAPLARLHEFLLGMVVAVALRRGWRAVSVRAATVLLVAGFAVLWLFRDAGWRSAVPYDAVNQLTAPLFALLIAAVASRDRRGERSLLRSGPLVRLGRYSYAFYLFHFTVVVGVASAVFPGKTVVDFFVHPVPASWSHVGWALVALVVSVALSGLLYRWYEYPAERRLRAFFRRRLRTPAPARPAVAPVRT